MNVQHLPDNEWQITSPTVLSDTEAAAVTFRAEPAQVTLGAHVTVTDPEGDRIGHVAAATYRERWDGPAYVVVTLGLR